MNTVKRILCGAAAVGMTVCCLSSCEKTTDITNAHYQYNLSEYITLPQYKGLDAVGTDTDLTEEQIRAEIESPLYYYAKTSPITDRGAEIGDTAIVSFVGFSEGERIVTQSQLEVILGIGTMPEEFENALLGHRTGDDVKFTIAYPDDFPNTEYAGRTVDYTVSMDGVYEYILPKYTDEFVRGYLGYNSIEEYERAVRTKMAEYYEELNTYYIISQLWPEIEEKTVVLQYPEKELEDTYTDSINAHKNLAKEHNIAFTDYVATYFNMSVDDFYDDRMEEAKADVKYEMICYAIARSEGITLSEKEYTERGEAYAKEQYGLDSLEAFEAEYGKDKIYRLLLCEKVQEWVAASANVEETLSPIV